MTVYRAAWLCPISRRPIHNGWFAVEEDRIARVAAEGEPAPAGYVRELGNVVVLPGLVNAHTHLELSWLRGSVPPAASFTDWIKQLFVTRGARTERPDDSRVIDAARAAAREVRESGTAAVGDISNSLVSVQPIRAAGLQGVVFHELLGFNLTTDTRVRDTRRDREAAAALGADAVRISVAPHAPYSVSPELLRGIRTEVDLCPVPITSVHLGESIGELEFLRDGSGPWPEMLRWVGSSRADWTPPGTGPVDYLDGLGVLDSRTLVVHGVYLEPHELRKLASIGCTLVTCPRSNQWVGVGVPPLERFYAAGVRVAVGTDSLASVEDLNLFMELKTMRWLAPSVPAAKLLESATLSGAQALGMTDDLGSIDEGKRAAVIAVELPPVGAGSRERLQDAESVEEHLLTGIDPRQVRWVAA